MKLFLVAKKEQFILDLGSLAIASQNASRECID